MQLLYCGLLSNNFIKRNFMILNVCTGDVERARAVYELAINQPRLDMPEILWKSYIDFEVEMEETDRAR